MKSVFTTFTVFILSFAGIAQNLYPKLSLYGNAGLPVQTNFDFKPDLGAYGDLGLKIKLYKGLSLQIEGNTYFFNQKINFKKLVANYFTQIMGVGVGLMYEKNLDKKWFLGIGGGYDFGLFTGRVYAPFQQAYFDITGFDKVNTTGNVGALKGTLQVRRTLNRYFSAQIGVSYFMSNSHLLDMFAIPSKSDLDAFTVLYGGLTLSLDDVFGFSNHRRGSRRLGCPRF